MDYSHMGDIILQNAFIYKHLTKLKPFTLNLYWVGSYWQNYCWPQPSLQGWSVCTTLSHWESRKAKPPVWNSCGIGRFGDGSVRLHKWLVNWVQVDKHGFHSAHVNKVQCSSTTPSPRHTYCTHKFLEKVFVCILCKFRPHRHCKKWNTPGQQNHTVGWKVHDCSNSSWDDLQKMLLANNAKYGAGHNNV